MEYGLIGEKLSHSFSKTVHNELCDYDYELKELKREELDSFFKNADFKAINVTIPYKEDVIKYLDEIDENAKEIGAVNTVVNKNGKLLGYNTDFLGLKALIEKNDIELCGKKVALLGSGGTSKTALAVARHLKASEVLRVSRKGGEGLVTYDELLSNHLDTEVIINTTPCGMFPNLDTVALDVTPFENLSGVVDAVYNPLNTKLVLTAKRRGIKAAGGLYMLIAQAFFAAQYFFNTNLDFSRVDVIYNNILKSKQNVVLIGMPSSGKTTVGKEVAKLLNKEFVDSDDEIVRFAGVSIPEIFEKSGEAEFRNLESKIIKELSALQGKVIATGGGAILRPENLDLLKQNGVVVFLDRSLENLITTDDRPLSSSREMLKKRYDERYYIYKAAADIIIDANGDVLENTNKVKEGFLNENFGA